MIATDIERCDEDLQEEFDSSTYDEIVHRYRDIIDSCCELCDFFIKVLYDYNDYQSPGKKPREKCLDFYVVIKFCSKGENGTIAWRFST